MSKSLGLAALMSVITLSPFGLAAAKADGLDVVASFSIIGDFARNVGGDRITLTTVVGPDGDAHVYEPSPADATAMAPAPSMRIATSGSAMRVMSDPKIEMLAAAQTRTKAWLLQRGEANGFRTSAQHSGAPV